MHRAPLTADEIERVRRFLSANWTYSAAVYRCVRCGALDIGVPGDWTLDGFHCPADACDGEIAFVEEVSRTDPRFGTGGVPESKPVAATTPKPPPRPDSPNPYKRPVYVIDRIDGTREIIPMRAARWTQEVTIDLVYGLRIGTDESKIAAKDTGTLRVIAGRGSFEAHGLITRCHTRTGRTVYRVTETPYAAPTFEEVKRLLGPDYLPDPVR